MSIADNLHRINERIARSAGSVGRRADEVVLVGVTKYVGAKEAAELFAAGCKTLGESRPQELWKKHDELKKANVSPTWHFIGHLQRNKVARTLGCTNFIHSVDSERLISEINQACLDGHSLLPGVNILLEVNTSGEDAKYGLAADDVERVLAAMSNYPRVFVLGLMTMAALEGGEAEAARNFAALRELRDRLKPSKFHNTVLNELSMGMSADFEVAIKEGATIVRVGSALWE
jgi:PLP dependent protein